MNESRFDSWSRKLAIKLSRREAITSATAAAVLSPLAHERAAAQFDGDSDCTMEIEFVTSAGPSSPSSFDGRLEMDISDDGSIEEGSLETNGRSFTVQGSAYGASLDLLLMTDEGEGLALTGVGEGSISDCDRDVYGVFSGPEPGDLGTWHAIPEDSDSESNGDEIQSSGSTQSGNSSQSSGSSEPAGPSCEPTECGDAFVFDTGECACVCATPGVPCGQNCCPSGSTCMDQGAGICSCPPGMEQCGTECVEGCAEGAQLNLDSCECEALCQANTGGCTEHFQCCSGFCGNNICQTCTGRVCGVDGCVDSTSDNNNCGNCSVICVQPQTCIGGVCQ